MCDPLYHKMPFTADVMTSILVGGVTSQNKIIVTDFTVIYEYKLDEMIAISSKKEVFIWAKYQ